jgi:hypothetical protein
MAASERIRRFGGRAAVVLVALTVALSAFAGPVAAASGSVELDAARDNQQATDTMTFQFTANANGTASAPGSRELDGGNVVFEFDGWNDLDSGASGSSSSWEVEAGHRYEVTYEGQAYSGADDREYSTDVSVQGPGGSYPETLYLDVNVQEPQFGGATRPEEQVIFRESGEASTSVDVEFDNDGPGVMVPESVTNINSPNGIDVSVDSLSDQVDAGDSGTASLDVTVDSSVSTGTHQISGTITDNLGNTQSFTADIDVRKPPVISVDDVDVGGVLRGESTTVEVTVSEVAGFSDVNGIDVNNRATGQGGSIDILGAENVFISAGGSETIEVEATADSDANQHATIGGEVELTPDNQHSPAETIDVEGEVFYPPNIDSLSGQSAENVFDTPRSEASVQETRTAVTFENTGDLEMDITGISASTDSADVDARVEDVPDTVGGLSSESATVVLEADPDAAEGSHSFTVDVDTATAGSQSITRELTIEHVPELGVNRDSMDLGDVTVTSRQTTSVDVSEVLEYESVPNVEVERTAGPNRYLEIVERPSELDAGESAPLVFAVTFNTSAELYEVYQWEFEISGEGVESQTVTVTARPTPYSFDSISDNLSAYAGGSGPRAETAAGMVESLETLEGQLRDGGDVPEGDLTETIAAGETAVLLLDSLESADEAREQNGSEAAQEHVLRARATLNAMSVYIDRIDSQQVRSGASGSLSAAQTATDEQVAEQESYYQSQLDGDGEDEPSTLQRANANRQLARLAEIRGESDRASQLNEEATSAFDTYLSQVESASTDAQDARTTRASIRENATLVLFDQPLVLNPARLDPISTKIDRIDAAYASAAETYSTAGATQEADAVSQERSATLQRLQFTQYGLWGATAFYGIAVAAVLLRTGRNLFAYLQDRRTVQLGAALQ